MSVLPGLIQYDARKRQKILKESRVIFFLGVNGISMSGLAKEAWERGLTVMGWDDGVDENTVASEMPYVFFTKKPEDIAGAELAVFSSAVSFSHPLMVFLRKTGVPCFSRAEYLGELMKPYPEKIGIAGMHGKSSTVGMCDSIFCTGGNPATTLSGAVLGGDEKQGSFRKGSPETLLFEACEYKKSFLHFSPTIAVALNAEWEHTDCYASLSEVYDAFSVYLQKESVKLAVVPKELLRLCGRKKLLTFGEGMDVSAEDVTMKEGKPRFYLRVFGRTVGEVRLQTVGEYQVQNALAAAAVGTALEISEEKILSGLSAFKGSKRRFEKIGTMGNGTVYLDYAHHPTELSVTLRAAKSLGKPIVCVFQGHTYTRVKSFYDRYCAILKEADTVGILPIYPAREKDRLGLSEEVFAKDCGGTFLPDFRAAADFLSVRKREETVLLIGAGDIEKILPFLPYNKS